MRRFFCPTKKWESATKRHTGKHESIIRSRCGLRPQSLEERAQPRPGHAPPRSRRSSVAFGCDRQCRTITIVRRIGSPPAAGLDASFREIVFCPLIIVPITRENPLPNTPTLTPSTPFSVYPLPPVCRAEIRCCWGMHNFPHEWKPRPALFFLAEDIPRMFSAKKRPTLLSTCTKKQGEESVVNSAEATSTQAITRSCSLLTSRNRRTRARVRMYIHVTKPPTTRIRNFVFA